MTSLVKHPDFGISGWRVFIKGGPDVILPKCKSYYSVSEGKNNDLSDDKNSEITKNINHYASESLRTIAIAYKDVDDSTAENFDKIDQNGKMSINSDGYNLLGVVGNKDPLKSGATVIINVKMEHPSFYNVDFRHPMWLLISTRRPKVNQPFFTLATWM